MRIAPVVVLAVASVAFFQKAKPRAIVTSGTFVDGKGLARFRSPQAGGGRVAFQASGDTVTLPVGDGTRELIGTGGAAMRHARYVRQRLVDRRAIGTSERIAELSGASTGPKSCSTAVSSGSRRRR